MNNVNHWLNKLAPKIGKFFRPFALVGIGITLFTTALVIFLELVDFHSITSVLESIWFIIIALFFIIAGFLALIWATKHDESSYETWGVYFYLCVIGIIVYTTFLKIVQLKSLLY